MADVKFNEENCKGCGLCMSACPKKIIRQSDRINKKGYKSYECFDKSACIGCAFCATMCPDCVIEVYK